MNNLLLVAAGVGIPVLAIVLLLIRRLTRDRQGLLLGVTWKLLLYAPPAIGVPAVLTPLLLDNKSKSKFTPPPS
jgi:hypothetical protein